MGFPTHRLSRLRFSPTLRDMVQENHLHLSDLIQPIFIHHGTNINNEIPSMPGQFQMSIDVATVYAKHLFDGGIKSVILFGIPESKDEVGSDALSKTGIIQQAIGALKKAVPDLFIITDVCFCEYTDHGHCGILKEINGKQVLDHDATLNHLQLQVISHANAGCDMVAPSGMIDGAVGAIRFALDKNSFTHLPIMGYSAKFASAFYGPFRDAADGAPQSGDRKSYQMNITNSDEAMREVALDIKEGADIVMVKPGLAYLDIVQRIKNRCNVPICIYNVSGEYAMVKAAAHAGWIDEKAIVLEKMICMKRAGANLIITYHAQDIAKWL